MSHHPHYLIPLNWENIEIEITYYPCWAVIPDGVMSHIGITTKAPPKSQLPITETGYRSHFFPFTNGDTPENIIERIKEWLDKEAKSPEWIKYVEANNQLSLF